MLENMGMEDTVGLVVRCTSCRNRTGIDGARRTSDGAVCCARCFATRVVLRTPEGEIEIVGVF